MAILKVTASEFDEKVLKAPKPVLLDFYADWCGPCKLAEPVLEELAKTYKEKVEFMKLNVDEEGSVAQKYQVMSIPTTLIIKNGEEVDRQIGFAGKEAFENLIKKAL